MVGSTAGTTIRLAHQPIEPAQVVSGSMDPRYGGYVTFVGAVRDENRGRRVDALHYEAYEPMAVAVLTVIAEEARQRFGVGPIAVHHRLGRLVPGDVSVVVAVGAAHRDAAFRASRYVIDELKRRAPIWKKESYDDGEAWIDGGTPGSGDASVGGSRDASRVESRDVDGDA